MAIRPITAPGCRLEPQLAAHAGEMFGVLSDPAIYEFENRPPESVAWLEDRFRWLESRGPADGSEDWLNWVVRLPGGELAGYLQATVRRDGTAYVAYELASRYWRQGLATRAVAAMLDELRTFHGVVLAIAVLKAANVRSLGLLRKLGFEDATPGDAARWRDEADELVCVRRLVEPGAATSGPHGA